MIVINGHICHILQILHLHTDMYAHINATYKVTGINHWTRSNIHIYFTTSLNKYKYKYGCHIPNIHHLTNIPHGHIDATSLHMCAKTQPTATSASPVIAKYVLETNMPTNLGIYAIYVQYLMCTYGGCMCTYATYGACALNTLFCTKWQFLFCTTNIYCTTNYICICTTKLAFINVCTSYIYIYNCVTSLITETNIHGELCQLSCISRRNFFPPTLENEKLVQNIDKR